MKKVLILLVTVVAFGFAANAQNAIGVRLGGGTAYGAEVSYQHALGAANRLEVDLGFSRSKDNYINLAGIYQWCNKFGSSDFGWFIGGGLNLGHCANHGFGVAVAFQIGLEFTPSSLPLQLTLDARPSWEFLLPEGCGYRGFGWGGALGVRYRF